MVDAEEAGAKAMPRAATPANAVPAATAVTRQRRAIRLELRARQRELREHNDDNDKADHTVGPPSWIPRNKQPSVTDVRGFVGSYYGFMNLAICF